MYIKFISSLFRFRAYTLRKDSPSRSRIYIYKQILHIKMNRCAARTKKKMLAVAHTMQFAQNINKNHQPRKFIICVKSQKGIRKTTYTHNYCTTRALHICILHT